MLLLMVIVVHFQEVSSRRRDQRTRMHVGCYLMCMSLRGGRSIIVTNNVGLSAQ